MVTAEFAVGLLGVLPLMFSLIAMTAVAANQVKLVEAARTGARVVARGESESTARATVDQVVPGAEVTFSRAAGLLEVRVHRRIDGPGLLPHLTLRARAVTPLEASDAP